MERTGGTQDEPDGHVRRWLGVQHASTLLHVHPNTLRRWSNKGAIRTYRVGPRGDRRYRREDVEALLRSQDRSHRSD